MKTLTINNIDYEVLENYKDALNVEELNNMFTEYFNNYDYILGDVAYSKLRLKGFCDKSNKQRNNINSFESIKDYIKQYCAYECKYFILKRVDNLTK